MQSLKPEAKRRNRRLSLHSRAGLLDDMMEADWIGDSNYEVPIVANQKHIEQGQTAEIILRFILSLCFLACLLSIPCVCAAADNVRPNVLVIVSDDQGYADVGFHGSSEVPTPNLDSLAKGGVVCTNGYASHPFCSPTRAGLLTGRYQARFGHEYNPVYDPLDDKEGLPLGERLLPQYFLDAGYKTGWIGKWHLGASPAHVPWERGFVETFGFIGGGHAFTNWKPNERQYTLPLTKNSQTQREVPEHLTLAFGQEAAEFVNRHQTQPWFLYLAFNAPHTPHQPTAEREQKFSKVENAQRRKYLAQISLLDDAIGMVTKALDRSGQSQRTLVFFFSDNGGPTKNGANNGKLRGQKGQVYEGGVRVPFVMRWPDKIVPMSTYGAAVSSLDVMATSLAAAGINMPSDKKYDSVNLLPHIKNEITNDPHPALFWRAANGKSLAVRQGDWKLVRYGGQPDELYNLADDASESNNLATTRQDMSQALDRSLNGWVAELAEPSFLGSSVKNEDWGPGGANQRNSPKKKDASKQE